MKVVTGEQLLKTCMNDCFINDDLNKDTIKNELNMIIEKNDNVKIILKELLIVIMKFITLIVKNKYMTLYEYGEIFKKTTEFGFIKSRPRPNWSVSGKELFENIFHLNNLKK